MKLLKYVLHGTLSILKLIWAWKKPDLKKLKREAKKEYSYAVSISIILFIVVFFVMVGMAENIPERVNRLERQMNYFNPNIPDMTVIK